MKRNERSIEIKTKHGAWNMIHETRDMKHWIRYFYFPYPRPHFAGIPSKTPWGFSRRFAPGFCILGTQRSQDPQGFWIPGTQRSRNFRDPCLRPSACHVRNSKRPGAGEVEVQNWQQKGWTLSWQTKPASKKDGPYGGNPNLAPPCPISMCSLPSEKWSESQH